MIELECDLDQPGAQDGLPEKPDSVGRRVSL